MQIQKFSCLMCVDELTSTFDDVMVVKEDQYLHPQKGGGLDFFFYDIIFSSSFLYPSRDNMCRFLF